MTRQGRVSACLTLMCHFLLLCISRILPALLFCGGVSTVEVLETRTELAAHWNFLSARA